MTDILGFIRDTIVHVTSLPFSAYKEGKKDGYKKCLHDLEDFIKSRRDRP